MISSSLLERMSPIMRAEALQKLDCWDALAIPAAKDRFAEAGEPFDPLLLPPPFGELIEAKSTELQVDVSACAAAFLGAVSIAVSGRLEIAPELPPNSALDCRLDGYREAVQLWILAVLPSSERKSSVFATFMRPIFEFQDGLNQTRRDDREVFERRLAFVEKRIAALTQKKTYNESEASELMHDKHDIESRLAPLHDLALTVSDSTAEAVAAVLSKNGGRTSLADAEGGAFGTIAGRYNNGVANLDTFLKGYGGERLQIDRISREPITVQRACLSMYFAVQPDVLNEIFENRAMRERGFLGRFTFVRPVVMSGYRTLDGARAPSHLMRDYERKIEQLLRLQEDDGKPKTLYMTANAIAAYREYAAETERGLRPEGGELAPLNGFGWAGKATGRMLRLAAILKMLDNADVNAPVEETHVRCAIGIARWSVDHARKLFGDVAPGDSLEMQLLNAIRRNPQTFGDAKPFTQGVLSGFASAGKFRDKPAYERKALMQNALETLQQWNVIAASVGEDERGKTKWWANQRLFVEGGAGDV